MDIIKSMEYFIQESGFFEDNKLIINDSLTKECEAVARLHFHPNILEDEIRERIITRDMKYEIKSYNYACEFNKLQKALVVEIPFKKELKVEIII